MFFNHPYTQINNQILTVASYAAAGDCLVKLENDKTVPDASKPDVTALVKELKSKLRTLYASEFIRYAYALAKNLNMQDEMRGSLEKYLRICRQLLEPMPQQREELQRYFGQYYYDAKHGQEYDNIRYILRCFVDCCAVQCLQKILASAPDKMKRGILGNIFPTALLDMLYGADDSMLEFMLDAGMKPDSYTTWTSFFRDSMSITLLTSIAGALRTRIRDAGSKESAESGKNYFSDQEIKAYAHFLGALLTRKADPDIDENYPGDTATPRGLAKDVLNILSENQYLSSEQKDKMASVLHIMINAPRIREFKPRTHYFDGGESGITAFSY